MRNCWLVASCMLAVAACAGTNELVAPPVTVAAPVAPPELPLASALPLPEWLPDSGVLAARVDVIALQKTGPLTALLEAWLGEHSTMLERARRVHVGVEPVAETDRVVLVIEADLEPAANGVTAWTKIARDAWVGCVRACDGYAVARTAITRAGDARALLLPSPIGTAATTAADGSAPQELAVVAVGELLDEGAPAKLALRERLLDTAVSVTSELRRGTLHMTQAQNVLTAELHLSFTSRGVASSASLLTRGAVFEAADELERVGLTREADLLYAVSMALGEDDMTAKLSVPLDAVPSLALAWLAARNKSESEPALQQ